MLTRYELARVVGMRALQLQEGAPPGVGVADDDLRRDAVYVAARELEARALDARLVRADGTSHHVNDLRRPPELRSMLDARDGGARGCECAAYASSVSGASAKLSGATLPLAP
jgi:DNA-directed RNA polymerase subunit K/omega